VPILGEVKHAKEIGHKGHSKFIWQDCADCQRERWVMLRRDKPVSIRCSHCGHKRQHPLRKNPRLGYGKYRDSTGYIAVYITHDNFFRSMADKSGRVREHRLVMAKHLKRCLLPWEIVHHKNGIKDDNRIENLQLISNDRHNQITILENKIKHLEKRVTLLEAENVLLRQETRKVNKFK